MADICRDLGLSPDWLALAEDCFAAEAALAGKARAAPAEPVHTGPMMVRRLGPDEAEPGRDSS